ncbi:hypothetical protein C8Q76DRAFT_762689 [Earliella scabrosa]|nr:hypothetical protein C8Q76DRAFT_762689 [Earliella scabrosa]
MRNSSARAALLAVSASVRLCEVCLPGTFSGYRYSYRGDCGRDGLRNTEKRSSIQDLTIVITRGFWFHTVMQAESGIIRLVRNITRR